MIVTISVEVDIDFGELALADSPEQTPRLTKDLVTALNFVSGEIGTHLSNLDPAVGTEWRWSSDEIEFRAAQPGRALLRGGS